MFLPGGLTKQSKTISQVRLTCSLKSGGGVGSKSRGYIIKQSVVAVHAIVVAIAYGELGDVDPDHRVEIPGRGGCIRTSDRWLDEWAEE